MPKEFLLQTRIIPQFLGEARSIERASAHSPAGPRRYIHSTTSAKARAMAARRTYASAARRTAGPAKPAASAAESLKVKPIAHPVEHTFSRARLSTFLDRPLQHIAGAEPAAGRDYDLALVDRREHVLGNDAACGEAGDAGAALLESRWLSGQVVDVAGGLFRLVPDGRT
ncbi:MAG: hypothetical protein ACLP0B_21275, partial [Steroidobacteraceae bacterium]